MEPGLSDVGTDPNVCYYPEVVWISRLGHSYHRPSPPIFEPLLDPLRCDQPLMPLLIPVDSDWEESEIWDASEPRPEPRPPPKRDSSDDIPPF